MEIAVERLIYIGMGVFLSAGIMFTIKSTELFKEGKSAGALGIWALASFFFAGLFEALLGG
jgi:hypothetical protein